MEAQNFRDKFEHLRKLKVNVFGVSPDSLVSHEKFKTKEHLNFELLSDPEKALSLALGVWVEKSMYGRKYMGILRTTFVVDETGEIVKVWSKVKVPGHVDEVLNFIRESR